MAAAEELGVWLENEALAQFKDALRLSTDEWKNDPETEPYKSKYAAREILQNLKNKLDSFKANEMNELRLKSVQSAVDLELGVNYVETDETGTGESYLNSVKENVEEFKLKPEFCSVMIKCLQQLGIVWNGRGDIEKSFEYFSKAEELYDEYKKVTGIAPFDSHLLFCSSEESKANDEMKFENLHTHTLYYLTQAYKNNGQNKKSAEYGHKTLQRQLLTKMYNPVDWAVNCATLSQFHLTQGDYESARHCLASASAVITECPAEAASELDTVDVENEGEDERKQRERVPEAKANIALCWSKYCLNLLKLSAETEDEEVKDSSKESENKEIMRFEGLDVSKIESEISSGVATNFEEARLFFLAGQKHLNDAKAFNQLDGYVVNHVEIIQDHSQMFKYLTAFELDLERQCKMCKRRIDMLTEVLVELNPQHYLLICRQLTYEIASVYGDMADLKIEIVKTSEKPSLHQIKKINSLLGNSAKFFNHFIDSLKQEGKLPEKYDETVLRVALRAHVYLARAHAKQICTTREERLMKQQQALELYKYVVDYCEKDEDGARAFHDELEACKEMVELLPFRLDQIGQGKN